MVLIKDKHNTLFTTLTTQLMTDLGDTVLIKRLLTSIDCEFCDWDARTKRSSGRPSSGMNWSLHPEYTNDLRCPNCNGEGKKKTYETTTVTRTYAEDFSGTRWVRGKMAEFPIGTKRVMGVISDVEINGENYLETAIKITIGSDDYTLASYQRLGIKTDHLFTAILERSELINR